MKATIFHVPATCLATALSVLPAQAQEAGGASDDASKVVVSAFRIRTAVDDATQGVSVLSADTIAALKPASAVELLQQIPGIYMDQVGRPGGVSNVYLRGGDPNHVLVLIDGVRSNDPTSSRGGGYDFSGLDPADIERVEVIRGAGSAQFGADAMAGVINIVTKRGKREGFSGGIGVAAGGQSYRQLDANLSGGNELVQASLNVSNLSDGEAADGAELDLRTVSASLAAQPIGGLRLNASARALERDGRAFPDFSGGIRFAVLRGLEQRDADESSFAAGVEYDATDWLTAALKLARFERDEKLTSPGVALNFLTFDFVPPTVSDTQFTRDTQLATLAARSKMADVVLGIERMDEEGVNKSTVDLTAFFLGLVPGDFRLQRDTRSSFIEAQLRPIDMIGLSLGVRRDRASGFASETSPSAGVRLNFKESGTSLRAHRGEGFRPPSFFALADPIAGNPNLLPETNKTTEVGIEQALFERKGQVSLAAFRTRYKNLIDFDPALFILVNRDEVEADGYELELSAKPIDALSFAANYTKVDTEIVGSTNELRNRPRTRAALSVSYRVDDAWRIGYSFTHVGEFFDSSVPTGQRKMDGYQRSDLSLAYRWSQFEAALIIDNVADEDYESYIGFVDPGRRLRLSLRASF